MSFNRIAKQKSKFAANQSREWDEFAYFRYRAYSWRIICLQAQSPIYLPLEATLETRMMIKERVSIYVIIMLWCRFSLFVVTAEAWISLSAAIRIIVQRSKTFDYLIGRHAEIHYLIFRGTGRKVRRTRKFPRRMTGKFMVILGMYECADLHPTPSLSYRVSSVL